MVYGYIRVSTDKQTVENQKLEIKRYCKEHRLKKIVWYSETVSGTKKPEKRQLGNLMTVVNKGDIVIVAESVILDLVGFSLNYMMITINLLLNIHDVQMNGI